MAQSQSTTTTPISSTDLDICVMRLARDAGMRGGNVLTSFQAYMVDYLAAETVQTPPTVNAGRRSRARTAETPAVTPTTTPTPTARIRSTSPSSGTKIDRVFAQIMKTPGITREAIATAVVPRYMRANEVGTCLFRLRERNYVSWTTDEKLGPFTATPAGIEANRELVTSINTGRRQRTGRTAAAAAEPTQQQATG